MITLGKSPSPKRVVAIAGAVAVLVSAVAPASAASPRKEPVARKQAKAPVLPVRPAGGGGGGSRSGPLSLEWRAAEPLRP